MPGRSTSTNTRRAPRAVLSASLLLGLACGSTLSFAQSAYKGIYLGTFGGAAGSGDLAIMVLDDNSARVVAFDRTMEGGLFTAQVVLDSSGSFDQSGLGSDRAVSAQGQFTFQSAAGTLSSEGLSADFAVTRRADQGDLSDKAGTYIGNFSQTSDAVGDCRPAASGGLFAIMAADGTITLFGAGGDEDFGFTNTVSSSGAIAGTTTSGARYVGQIDTRPGATQTEGTWSSGGCEGIWGFARQDVATARADTDNDQVPDVADNCVDTPNTDQADADNDDVGDACTVPVFANAGALLILITNIIDD